MAQAAQNEPPLPGGTGEQHLKYLVNGVIHDEDQTLPSVTVVISLSVFVVLSNSGKQLKLITQGTVDDLVQLSHRQHTPTNIHFWSNKKIDYCLWRGFYEFLRQKDFRMTSLKGLWDNKMTSEYRDIFPEAAGTPYQYTAIKPFWRLRDFLFRAGDTSCCILIDTHSSEPSCVTVR